MDDIPIPTNETSQGDKDSTGYTVTDAILDITIFLVVLVNLLIIFVITINKRLQTRIYWIFLNWMTNATLLLVSIIFRAALQLWFSLCLLIHIDYLFPINCTLLMLVMISNTLVDGKYSLWIILGLTYISTILLLTGFTLLCVSIQSLLPGFLTFMAISLILFISIIVKEYNKYKKNKTTPLRAKTVFRHNLARIFIYNFMIVIFLYVFLDKAIESKFGVLACMMSFLLTPLYELIYILVADKNFRIATFNVFKSAGNWRRLDAEFNLTDDE